VQRSCEGGSGCDLDLREAEPTRGPACPCVDCVWGEWAPWSECSLRCDGGQRTRARHILKAPEPGCKPCEAKEKEQVEPCNTQPCHQELCVNGEWADWSDWEVCSTSCRGGQTWRSRKVRVEANECGMPATGLSMQHQACNLQVPCTQDVDCLFGDWEDWGPCSSTCTGVQKRHRSIMVQGRANGYYCEGPLLQTAPCRGTSGVLDWSNPRGYLDLSHVTNNNLGGAGPGTPGAAAAGQPPTIRFHAVASRLPPHCEEPDGNICRGRPVDLVVSVRGEYTGCDVQANGRQGANFGAVNVAAGQKVDLELSLIDASSGVKVVARELALKVFDLDGGAAGTSKERVAFKDHKEYRVSDTTSLKVADHGPDGGATFEASKYGTDDDNPKDPTQSGDAVEDKAVAVLFEDVSKVGLSLEVTSGLMCKTFLFAAKACISEHCQADPCHRAKHRPVDCVLGGWQDWGPCDARCGVGQKIRSREIVQEPAFGGFGCTDTLSQTAACQLKPCLDPCRASDCTWGQWGEWSSCDRCGGERRRFRQMETQAACGGRACEPGAAAEVSNCTRACHAVHYCVWDDWHPFGPCSATCGTGLMSRSRYLKAVAEPPSAARAMLDLPLSDQDLESKFGQLKVRTERIESNRFQIRLLAAVAGALTSVAGVAAVRGAARQGCCGREAEAARYGRVPTESPSPRSRVSRSLSGTSA